MVRPLPILRPNAGRNMARANPLLRALQQTAEARNARGLGPRLRSLQWSSALYKSSNLQPSVFFERVESR
jgi:hypothetical protein